MQSTTIKAGDNKIYLYRCCAKLMASTTLGNFWEVIDQPLKYVSSIQVTVIVHVDVHHTLGIWEGQDIGWSSSVSGYEQLQLVHTAFIESFITAY